VIDAGKVKIPVNLERPAALAWLLKEIQTIVAQQQPNAAAWKKPESGPARGRRNDDRVEAEAILQAAVHGVGVDEIKGFVKRSLKKILNFEGEARDVTDVVDGLAGLGTQIEELEAAVAAVALLPEV
jgi:hypothetical protein